MIPPKKTVFFFLDLSEFDQCGSPHFTSPHLPVRTFPLPSPPSPNGTPIVPAENK